MPGPYSPADPKNYVGVGLQSVRGTVVAPTVWGAYIDPVDLAHNQTINRILEAGNAGTVTWTEKPSQLPSGGFTILARPSIVSRLTAFLAGRDTIGAAVSGVFPHVVDADIGTDYLSIEQNEADEGIERFQDSVIAEMAFSCSIDAQTLRAKTTWAGGQPNFQASATAESYETELPWIFSECAFTIDGSSDTQIREFNLTWRFIYDAVRTSLVTPSYMIKLRQEVELDFTRLETGLSNTGYRKVNYGTTSATVPSPSATSGSFAADFTRGAAGTAREFKLAVATLDYDVSQFTSIDPNGNEALKTKFEGKGRTTAGASLVVATGKNLDAVAYVP